MKEKVLKAIQWLLIILLAIEELIEKLPIG